MLSNGLFPLHIKHANSCLNYCILSCVQFWHENSISLKLHKYMALRLPYISSPKVEMGEINKKGSF